MQERRIVSHEALGRAAGRVGTLAGWTEAGRYLDRLLSEVEAEEAARRTEVEAEVRRRWEACSEDIEAEVSGYAINSYEYWIEDANRDHEDEDQTPKRRRSRYSTLGEWADAEETDIDEGTGYYPRYARDIAGHAEEMAGRRLVRKGDAKDLRKALEKSISERKWSWPGIETASILTA